MKFPERSKYNRFSKVDRASRYIETMPGAIDGEGGHNALFTVACRLVHGFGLSVDQSMEVLRAEYNLRCDPQWSEQELLHKCNQAAGIDTHQKPKEHLVGDDTPPWEQNGDHKTAEKSNPPESPFANGFDLLNESLIKIDAREPEIIYDCGDDLPGFELGPGKVTVIGAPPGTGKTSLASQIGFCVLMAHTEVPLVIANAEMDPGVLIRREIARRASMSYHKVRFATYSESESEALYVAAGELVPLMKRTQIMTPPYLTDRLMKGLDEDRPGVLVVDYLQKFRHPGSESMEGIEVVMGCLRLIAMAGWAVLALSSTSRGDNKGGGKHDTAKLDMGSFRGSGEIEFQADAAYVLRDQSAGAEGDRSMVLDCVKNRHGSRHSLELTFKADQMRFESAVQKDAELDSWNQKDF